MDICLSPLENKQSGFNGEGIVLANVRSPKSDPTVSNTHKSDLSERERDKSRFLLTIS